MSREQERIAIDRALNDLGDTSAQVAQTLRTKGIKGRAVGARSCPIFNYLKILSYRSAGVTQNYIADEEGLPLVGTTPAVHHFIADFDRGLYPDLEET
jgi:hypothetical protein